MRILCKEHIENEAEKQTQPMVREVQRLYGFIRSIKQEISDNMEAAGSLFAEMNAELISRFDKIALLKLALSAKEKSLQKLQGKQNIYTIVFQSRL